jgi:hypothetical protein
MVRLAKQTVHASIDGDGWRRVQTVTRALHNKGSWRHKQTKDTACNSVLKTVGPCVSDQSPRACLQSATTLAPQPQYRAGS